LAPLHVVQVAGERGLIGAATGGSVIRLISKTAPVVIHITRIHGSGRTALDLRGPSTGSRTNRYRLLSHLSGVCCMQGEPPHSGDHSRLQSAEEARGWRSTPKTLRR
jgi:hypothetical protein